MDAMYRGINLKPADNGGFVLEYYTYKENLRKSHGVHTDHVEAFTAAEENKAMDRLIALHKENIAHYKKSMGKKQSSHN